MSRKTLSLPMEDDEIFNFSLQKSPSQFSWANATKHHCGICWKKLRHSCIGTHTVTCEMYHGSLFMKGNETSCKDCRQSQEAFESRVRGIGEAAKDLFPAPDATPPKICDVSKSPFQGSRKAKKEAKRFNKALGHGGRALKEAELANVRNGLAHILDGASVPDLDQKLARENAGLLSDSRFWAKSTSPGAEERGNYGTVLAAMHISCQEIVEDADKIRLVQPLVQLLSESINASIKELESKNSRMADLKRLLSRKAAQALQDHHDNVQKSRNALTKQDKSLSDEFESSQDNGSRDTTPENATSPGSEKMLDEPLEEGEAAARDSS